jgi:hypothetical protein
MHLIVFRGAMLWSLASICLILPTCLQAQRISDFKMRYSLMTIKEATLEKVGTLAVDFYRQNFDVELGLGQAFVGFIYQYATKDKNTSKLGNTFGVVEDGLMLTAGYNWVLSNRLRLDSYGRLGIWGDTNYAQALYATDTDLRLNLVFFDLDGAAVISRQAVFPSGQVGVNVNKFGRVQGVAGAGLWWNNIGTYLTGFTAFNGVNEALNPGKDVDKIFANLKNSGVSLGVTYEFYDFMLWVRQNRALKNGGHDFTVSLQYQHFFPKGRPSENKF